MLKFKYTIFVLFLANSLGNTQNLSPMNPGFRNEVRKMLYDSTTGYIYAGGKLLGLVDSNYTPMRCIARWDGFNWDSLGTGVNDGGQIRSMLMYNGELIVAGTFSTIGGIAANGLARWDGTTWLPFVDAPSAGHGCALSLYLNGSNLYVGGCFDSINGIPAKGIARFDGTNWFTYPTFQGNFHYITSIIEYNNELYVGGNFAAGVGKEDIMKFDGSSWVTVGGGLSGAVTVVDAMEIYQGDLYVSGYFQTAFGDPGNNIAMWNGTTWSQLGNGLQNANVFALHVFDNKLYAGGNIQDASGVPIGGVAIWDGLQWEDFDGNFLNNAVCAFESVGNRLYLGGSFYIVNGDSVFMVCYYELPNQVPEFQHNDNVIVNYYNNALHVTGAKNHEMKIINTLGQCLYKTKLNSDVNSVDVSFLSTNMYLIQLTHEKFERNTKIMIIK